MIELDEIEMPAGTLVVIAGVPFQLKAKTVVLGRKANAVIALERIAVGIEEEWSETR